MWTLCLLFICPLLSVTPGEDTVAEDLGSHQLQRLVELLTHQECEDLLVALSHPEENIFQHLERLSPEKNQLDIKPRSKRDTSSSDEENIFQHLERLSPEKNQLDIKPRSKRDTSSSDEENIFQHLERLSPEKNQLDIKPRSKRDTSSSDEENIFQHLERLSPEKNQLDIKPRSKRDTSSSDEENIFQHLKRLSPEKNQLDIKPRSKRDTSSSDDSEAKCQAALTAWLLRYGERIYYDKLSRALMHIGRTDIAIEVGTNVNEDKDSNLKRYVDGYHKYVRSLDVPSVQPDAKRPRAAGRKRKRAVKDLSWRDLDLLVEVSPVLPYLKGPLDVLLPVLYGVLLGFGGSLLAGAAIILISLHVSRRAAAPPNPRVTGSSYSYSKLRV